jgi:hypothetical protein
VKDIDEYILKAIRTWVWCGFYSPHEVEDIVGDLLEGDTDEAMVRAAISREFDAKAVAERSWPERTDCDRLDEAFAALNQCGVIALHNAGFTMSDGITEVAEVLHRQGRDRTIGYCFYHGQDVERVVAGDGLTIAFGALDDSGSIKQKIGSSVKETLERHGFAVAWNGNAETRLNIPAFDWKRRYRA